MKPGTLVSRCTFFPAVSVRTLLDLPSSRATPVSTCHVLRPRWYRGHSPFLRVRDCCFPVRSSPSAFTSCNAYPSDHNYTIFRGSMDSLYSRSTLAKAHTVTSIVRGRLVLGFTTCLLARLWLGGTEDFSCTHWVTLVNFRKFIFFPRLRIYLGTRNDLLEKY